MDRVLGTHKIDVLVSNAGEIFYAAVEATPPEALARLLDINTIGALRVAQAVLPGMRARGRGRLLFMSSVAGRIAPPRQAAYAATKWALEALVEALAIEAGPLGIEAALLEPGPVSSSALNHVTAYTLPGDPYAHLLTQGGARASQMITPEEVAAGIADAAEAPNCPCASPSAGPPPRSWPHARPHPDRSYGPGRPARRRAVGWLSRCVRRPGRNRPRPRRRRHRVRLPARSRYRPADHSRAGSRSGIPRRRRQARPPTDASTASADGQPRAVHRTSRPEIPSRIHE